MKTMQEWAIQSTLENGWDKHAFHKFLKNSNQSEFLQSQIPFFYAVESFPRFLAKLASQIETSSQRLLVIENLFEEHGGGDPKKFHTETFKEFLTALGWGQELHQNPWVSEWVTEVMGKDWSSGQYAAYLAGIEFAYAPISQTIQEHLLTLELVSPQSHYASHAELDWIHGSELLEVAETQRASDEEMKAAFEKAQEDFLNLYNHLIVPTAFEMKAINKESISFYYTREDSAPELLAVTQSLKSKTSPSVLMIGSGGETLIDLMSLPCSLKIDVVDMNPHQLELCQSKIRNLMKTESYSNQQEKFSGKFEKVFARLRDLFDFQGEGLLSTYIATSKIAQEKLKYIVNDLFSNQNLSYVFGERATQFSSESFSEHFYQVFLTACHGFNQTPATQTNIFNIIDGVDIVPSQQTLDAFFTYFQNHDVTYTVSDFESLPISHTYDVISISNIGDWMSVEDYKKMLEGLRGRLTPKGVLIARKLLGDYTLSKVLMQSGFNIQKTKDSTYFYSEVCLAVKS